MSLLVKVVNVHNQRRIQGGPLVLNPFPPPRVSEIWGFWAPMTGESGKIPEYASVHYTTYHGGFDLYVAHFWTSDLMGPKRI